MKDFAVIILVGLACGLLAGCGSAGGEASFNLQERTHKLAPLGREPLTKVLTEKFGTPKTLAIWDVVPVDFGAAERNASDKSRHAAGWKLQQGRSLYMLHCVHCHGVTGDGQGPTASFLQPRPRDYRNGVFKFTSTATGMKPSTADLKRILENGIPGTSMPSFALLSEESLSRLVDYVRWLSFRGEMELKLVSELAAMGATQAEIDQRIKDGREAAGGETEEAILKDVGEIVADEFPGLVDDTAADLAEQWAQANASESQVVPQVKRAEPSAESIARGRELYASKKAKCVDCHGPTGLGNGPLTEDHWSKPNTNPEEKYERPGLHDLWGNPQLARNLQRGQYRGGRRPIDVFRRIYSGIKGTQMPAFGGTALTDEEIWDLVNYVMSMPFEGEAGSVAEGSSGQGAGGKQGEGAKQVARSPE